MCQHNKAGVVASWRRDKVGDIECLVPDLASGDSLSLWGMTRRRRGKKSYVAGEGEGGGSLRVQGGRKMTGRRGRGKLR